MTLTNPHTRPVAAPAFAWMPLHRPRLLAAAVSALVLVGGGTLQIDGAAAADSDTTSADTRVGHTLKSITVKGSTQNEDRAVQVHLWYPAEQRGFADLPESEYRSRLWGDTRIPQGWGPSWTVRAEIAREGAAIAPNGAAFPVIVFSHGSVNDPIDYAHTLERIAGAGFVVAAPTHVNNTQDDVRIDFFNANRPAGTSPIPCNDARPSPCSRGDVPRSMTDRVRDISKVLDTLPEWFEDRVDVSRAGVLGHSRGTVTALAAAGGSTSWGFSAEPRVDAVMGLAIGAANITSAANITGVTVPTLLVAGGRDRNPLPTVSKAAFDELGTADKAFVLIKNATHRSFDSTYCDQLRAAGSFATLTPGAILDRHTAALISGRETPPTPSGYAAQYCSPATFDGLPSLSTQLGDDGIRSLVTELSGFHFEQLDPDTGEVKTVAVPTSGLDTDEVKAGVTQLAVSFFGTVLKRVGNDGLHFTRDLAPKWLEKHGILFEGSDDVVTLPNGTVVTGDAEASAGPDAVCPPGMAVDCAD